MSSANIPFSESVPSYAHQTLRSYHHGSRSYVSVNPYKAHQLHSSKPMNPPSLVPGGMLFPLKEASGTHDYQHQRPLVFVKCVTTTACLELPQNRHFNIARNYSLTVKPKISHLLFL